MSSHCAALSTATDSMIFGGRISPKNSATPLRRKNTVVHLQLAPLRFASCRDVSLLARWRSV